MRIVVAVMAMLLALPVFAAQDTAPLKMERTVEGEIEIAPDGSVHGYVIEDELAPALVAALDRSIRKWRFEPVTVDGRAVLAQTRMRIDLQLVPEGENFAFRVNEVYFGVPGSNPRMTPPSYPVSAVRAALGAKVSLVLKLSSDGKVEKVHVEQVSLDHRTRTDRAAERWRKRFAEASIEAAQQWSFDLTTRVDGQPVGTSVRVPIVYTIVDSSRDAGDSAWQAFVPGPYVPAPWSAVPEAEAIASIAKLGNGEVQPLDSRFKLLDGVIGSML